MRNLFPILPVFSMLLLSNTHSQTTANDAEPESTGETGLRFYDLLGIAGDRAKELLNDPETYNKYLIEKVLAKTDADAFLQQANIKFLTLTSESEDNRSSLGLAWDYTGTWSQNSAKPPSTESYEWIIDLKTKGNVAFDQDVNAADFLTFSLGGMHTARFGGIIEADVETIQAGQNWMTAIQSMNEEQMLNSEVTENYIQLIRQKAGAELYLETGMNLGFETDQKFENYQATFGFATVLDYKAWDDRLAASRANVFDYPSALFRWISGVDKTFTPNGASIPTLVIGVDRVEPLESQIVVRGGDDSGYFRAKAELATKSLFAQVMKERIYLEMNARIFQELGASSTIKSLGVDQQLIYTIAFVTSRGWYVSYSEGDLPFDMENDRAFGVGFKYSFD